jgi:hypothetical protein
LFRSAPLTLSDSAVSTGGTLASYQGIGLHLDAPHCFVRTSLTIAQIIQTR